MTTPVCDALVSEVVVVDRIVDEVAVVEWSPSCVLDVPLLWLPPGLREGDRLSLRFRRLPPSKRGGDRPPHARAGTGPEAAIEPRSKRAHDHADG